MARWDDPEGNPRYDSSTWVLVTDNRAFIERSEVADAVTPWTDDRRLLWTDDYGSLLSVLQRDDDEDDGDER